MDIEGFIKGAGPGLGITLAVVIIAHLVASLHPSFDVLVISIVFGMLVANMFDNRDFMKKGLDVALKVFLPAGIALYGLKLRLTAVEVSLVPAVGVMFVLMFGVSYFVARGFGLRKELAALIGTGLSACGASAIVIIAPLIGARKEETSISILSVVTVGLTGMLFYKFLPGMVDFTTEKFAFLAGTTLPMLGQVKVAASAMGPESLSLAMGFKLLRVGGLAAVAVLASIFWGGGRKGLRLPWFLAVFLALAVAVNVSGSVAALAGAISPFSKIFLATALTAIGLSIDFESITEEGTNPLLAASLGWGIIVMFLYLIMSVVI